MPYYFLTQVALPKLSLGYYPAEPRANNITVEHLLSHTAGYDWEKTNDVEFSFRNVAQSVFNGMRPATLRGIIEYQAGLCPGYRRNLFELRNNAAELPGRHSRGDALTRATKRVRLGRLRS